MEDKDNPIKRKSRDFAIEIIRLYKWLVEVQHEYVLSKQILRSGTSVGANVAEGIKGQSRPNFYSKMHIALKEANETSYWLDIMHATEYIPDDKFELLNAKCDELISILVAIVKNQNNS